MYRNRSLRIFPLILIIIVIVALIAGIITVGRYLFSGSGNQETENETTSAKDELVTINESRSVQMTLRGPIVANEEFRTYRITVSPTSREYKIYSGYLESVKQEKSYRNNMRAYEQFVHALDKAAMTKAGKKKESDSDDIRGICATGRVYEYAILNAGEPVRHYWTSTCKGSPGTFGASVDQVTDLFVKQIPDADRPEFQENTLRLF